MYRFGVHWHFADTGTPEKVVLQVRRFDKGRIDGEPLVAMKAFCKRHSDCICWVTKALAGANMHVLLLKFLKWSVDGKGISKAQHQALGADIKRSYGMRV